MGRTRGRRGRRRRLEQEEEEDEAAASPFALEDAGRGAADAARPLDDESAAVVVVLVDIVDDGRGIALPAFRRCFFLFLLGFLLLSLLPSPSSPRRQRQQQARAPGDAAVRRGLCRPRRRAPGEPLKSLFFFKKKCYFFPKLCTLCSFRFFFPLSCFHCIIFTLFFFTFSCGKEEKKNINKREREKKSSVFSRLLLFLLRFFCSPHPRLDRRRERGVDAKGLRDRNGQTVLPLRLCSQGGDIFSHVPPARKEVGREHDARGAEGRDLGDGVGDGRAVFRFFFWFLRGEREAKKK